MDILFYVSVLGVIWCTENQPTLYGQAHLFTAQQSPLCVSSEVGQ